MFGSDEVMYQITSSIVQSTTSVGKTLDDDCSSLAVVEVAATWAEWSKWSELKFLKFPSK